MDLKLIGSRIRELRQEKKLTQSEFAEILGVSFQAVSSWERGIAPPELENLIRIATFFEVLVDDLLRPRAESLYLGIDGGGTKTEFTVVFSDGRIISGMKKKGCNPNDVGFMGLKDIIAGGIHDICKEFPSLKSVFCGIAGITLGNYADRLRSELKMRFPNLKIEIKNDAFNLLAINDGAEIAVISGTGSVVFVKAKDGFKRLGGWGYIFDSAGSGFDIGRDAVRLALLEEDNMEKPSLLSRLLLERMGVSTAWEHISTLYSEGRAYIAGLSSVVFDAYAQGDKNAERIINNNAKALAELLNRAVELYGVNPVAIASGGIFEHYPKVMTSHIKKYSDVRLLLCDVSPVYGACRNACGADCTVSAEQFYQNFKNGGTAR